MESKQGNWRTIGNFENQMETNNSNREDEERVSKEMYLDASIIQWILEHLVEQRILQGEFDNKEQAKQLKQKMRLALWTLAKEGTRKAYAKVCGTVFALYQLHMSTNDEDFREHIRKMCTDLIWHGSRFLPAHKPEKWDAANKIHVLLLVKHLLLLMADYLQTVYKQISYPRRLSIPSAIEEMLRLGSLADTKQLVQESVQQQIRVFPLPDIDRWMEKLDPPTYRAREKRLLSRQ